MNKLLTKIAGVALGLTMAIGVGVSIGANREEVVPVHAAGPVTFDATKDSGSGSITKSGITVSMSTMNRSQKDNFRANSGSNIVVSSTVGNITSAAFTCTGSGTNNYGPGKMNVNKSSAGSYSYSGKVGTWTGDASTFTLATTAQVRVTLIEITYTAAAVVEATGLTITASPTTVYAGEEITVKGDLTGGSGAYEQTIGWTSNNTSVIANPSNSEDGVSFTVTPNSVDSQTTVTLTGKVVSPGYATSSTTIIVKPARTLDSVYINGSLEQSSYYTTDSEWDLTGLELWGDYNEGDDEKLGNVVDLIDAGDMILSIDPETPTDATTSTTSIRLYDILYGDEMVDGVEKTVPVTVSERPFADIITYKKTASVRGTGTSAWGTPGSVTDYTGASYYIYSMGVSSTDKAVRWNANGYLYSTVAPTNAKVKSVEIASISTGKSINVYGSNTAYSTVPLSGNVSSLNENTLSYTFEDDYKYIALKGTDSSTEVGTITITYELLVPKLTLGASTLEMSTSSTDNTITVVTENFDSGTIGYSYAVSGDDVLESYSVSAGKLSITSKSTTGTATLTVTATLGTQIASASVDVTVAESRNLTALAITPNTGNREFEQYATLTAGNLEVVASFDAEPTSQSFTNITSEDTKGLTFSPALGSELSTSGSVEITVSYTYRGVTKTAQYTITVNAYVARTWTKVTTAPADWRGTYLVVYEEGTNAYILNSALETPDAVSNYISGTISSNAIAGSKTIDAAAVQVERNTISDTSYYHIKFATGKYVVGTASKLNTQGTATANNAAEFEFKDGVLGLKVGGTNYLKFNSSTGQTRFRFYASGQKDVSLYKMDVTTAINNEVSSFVSGFDTAFGSTVCKTDGTTNVSTVNSNWTAQSKEFAKLSVDAQGILANTTYTHDAETTGSTADIVDRYDYIYGKYSASLTKGDFMNRSDAGTLVAYSARVNPLNVRENGGTTAVIVIISLVSVTALGGYFFIKKKKEQ